VLDPVTLHPGRARGRDPAGKDPRGRQVTFLPQVGADYPHVEVLPLDASKPAVEHPDGRVYGNGLVIVGRGSRPDRTGIDAVLPEERADPSPVPLREGSGIAAEQLLNGVLVAAGTRGGTVLDPAPRDRQETDPEAREVGAA
jgi:hypothetical protein